MARNKTASTRWPNFIGPLGQFSKKNFFQGHPNDRLYALISLNHDNTRNREKIKKNYIFKVKGTNDSSKIGNKEVKSNIRIIQINVEGMSRSKIEIIIQLFGDADVLTIQETHVPADQMK